MDVAARPAARRRFMSAARPTLQDFTESQTAKMLGLSRRRLRAWARAGVGQPSLGSAQVPRYTFQDLVALRAAKVMVERGVSLRAIREGVERLKHADAPGEVAANCLARHPVQAHRGRWSVRWQGRTLDPLSGQLSLDFGPPSDTAGPIAEDPAVLRLPGPRRPFETAARGPVPPEADAGAQAWYVYAADCELLWDTKTATDVYFRRAQQGYLRAVELDDSHAPAWTNLATLHASVGETTVARQYYELAVRHDPTLPEPFCNLAELDMREGHFEDAQHRFERVLDVDPEHLEAMYGAARAAIALGDHGQGVGWLRRFCDAASALDPEELDDELSQRVHGARLVIDSHEGGYTAERDASPVKLVCAPSRGGS